jgi:hypothetical protein
MQYVVVLAICLMISVAAFAIINTQIKRYWIIGFDHGEPTVLGAFNDKQLSDNTARIHQMFGGDFLVIKRIFTSKSKIMDDMLERDRLNRFANRINESI